MRQGHVPGMALLEVRDGIALPEVVRGVRANGTPDAVVPGDPWHIGSNAKPMTAILIARLVQQGKLSWSTPLGRLLPSLAGSMRAEYRDATLVDLLSHRSGLPENTDIAFLESFYDRHDPLPQQRLAYVARALRDAPAAARGTYRYSNTGFILAAVVAENATHVPYEVLVRTEVFEPLGMPGAGFGPTSAGQPLGHEGGKPQLGPRADNPSMFAPAGGIFMPMQDWAKFAIDQIEGAHGKGRLLSQAGYAFLQSPIEGGDAHANGLDWGVHRQAFGILLTHNGSNGYWYAVIGVSPESRNAILVAANAAEDAQGDVVTGYALRETIGGWGKP